MWQLHKLFAASEKFAGNNVIYLSLLSLTSFYSCFWLLLKLATVAQQQLPRPLALSPSFLYAILL